jgi:hypothetical protein
MTEMSPTLRMYFTAYSGLAGNVAVQVLEDGAVRVRGTVRASEPATVSLGDAAPEWRGCWKPTSQSLEVTYRREPGS